MTLIITINACLWFFYYESYIVFFGLVNFIGPYKVFLKKTPCKESADNFLVGIIMGKK